MEVCSEKRLWEYGFPAKLLFFLATMFAMLGCASEERLSKRGFPAELLFFLATVLAMLGCALRISLKVLIDFLWSCCPFSRQSRSSSENVFGSGDFLFQLSLSPTFRSYPLKYRTTLIEMPKQ